MKIEIKDLHARIADTDILKGVNLTLNSGEIHALMGPNGSGKSTLSNVMFGNETYEVTGGQILVDGQDILEMETHERAQLGLFLAFQYPVEIPGVTVGRFLKRAAEIRFPGDDARVRSFVKHLRSNMQYMEMDQQFINRYLNEGFSGGEKKRMEILQMLMLEPEFAILDETDSGLDIDALKIVSQGVNKLRDETPFGALIITHYQRMLDYIKPDFVHIMYQGRIVTSGGADLVGALEEHGYDWVKKQHGIQEEASHEQQPAGLA
ncbi:Iron-regulated ABC transporter ATPase subunit SufC [Alkalispirochaeta americana]|uniref:Iron-regulated ABC transporter ATPase subunit SufC n=1 Tax=Alkalispirochaeta americana TaxID=159291 RepID=A0A1N6NFD4_9SPIO|nr:Fe-S cluster assembly ATPase SufC [Alkalispirochaeta americana]SIP90800.1 Iron-regulated ABC transporter ATPase subunit SufC [Alkalispirochaeta americana]